MPTATVLKEYVGKMVGVFLKHGGSIFGVITSLNVSHRSNYSSLYQQEEELVEVVLKTDNGSIAIIPAKSILYTLYNPKG